MDNEGWLEEGPNTTKRPNEGGDRHGEATKSTENATEKTTTKSPRQILLAHVGETSWRLLHALCHGSLLTLLRFIMTVVLGLHCALKRVRWVKLWHWRFHKVEKQHLWMSSGVMNDAFKLCHLHRFGADLPYHFGHALVHQAFRRRDLPFCHSPGSGSVSARSGEKTVSYARSCGWVVRSFGYSVGLCNCPALHQIVRIRNPREGFICLFKKTFRTEGEDKVQDSRVHGMLPFLVRERPEFKVSRDSGPYSWIFSGFSLATLERSLKQPQPSWLFW